MDTKSISEVIEDLEAVEPEVADDSLKDLLKQLFMTFKQLSDTLTGDGDTQVTGEPSGPLDIPADAAEVSPLTGDSLEDPEDASAEGSALDAAGDEKEEDADVPGSGLGDEIDDEKKKKKNPFESLTRTAKA